MFGAVIKTYYAEKAGNVLKTSTAFLLCLDCQKFEAKRPEVGRDGYQDIDAVLTVQELAKMIRYAGIDFTKLPESNFDAQHSWDPVPAKFLATGGGVMEAALRTVYKS